MKNTILCSLLILGLVACRKSNPVTHPNTPAGCGPTVMIDSVRYHDPFTIFTAPVEIDSVYVSGDCMTVRVRSGGCDGSSWQLDAWDRGDVNNGRRELSFFLHNDELCQAYVAKYFKYDLSSLRVANRSSVELHFNQNGKSVIYSY